MIMKFNRKVDLVFFVLTIIMAYLCIVLPNPNIALKDPALKWLFNQVWYIAFVKAFFAFMACLFLESSLFIGAPLQRLFVRFIFGEIKYKNYMKKLSKAS